MDNVVRRLAHAGQSVWLDAIHRDMFASGRLAAMIAEGLLGMTSNPTIFEKAVSSGGAYDATIARLARAGAGAESIAEAIALEDVGAAAEAFRPVHERTGGADGYVSIEVSPRLARDTAGTLQEARRLWNALAQPNVMVKIPATAEGVPAIEAALAEGINVNATLMFSMAHYEAVAEAYLRALERRLEAGQAIDRVAGVASFFVSRVDTKADPALAGIAREGGPHAALAMSAAHRVAIANSRRVYRRFRGILAGERFRRLAARGARAQRVLWASTSTKDPSLPDTLYVDELVGPDTVNTVPEETWAAVLDHGRAERTVDADPAETDRVLEAARTLGLDLGRLGEELSDEGVVKFARSHEGLVAAVEGRRRALAA